MKSKKRKIETDKESLLNAADTQLNYEKEVAERWKRGAEGVPLPNRLGGLGSVVSSPSGVRGGAPTENEFGAFCGR